VNTENEGTTGRKQTHLRLI